MNAEPGRSIVLAGLFVLPALAVLIGLGIWQLERKSWKDALIATLKSRLEEVPMALPTAAAWEMLDPGNHEFRRVSLRARFMYEREALVYTPGSSLRPDIGGPGYWVFVPAALSNGDVIVVNRGFVPEARRDRVSRSEGQVSDTIDIIGVLRWPERRGWFLPNDDPARNVWFVRDPVAIAAAKGWGDVPPIFVDQESPVPPGGWPKPGPLTVRLRNDHLQYALTWFGLALALVAVFAVWAVGMRRNAAAIGGAPRGR